MSGFQPMAQPIYHCRVCKVNICQSCAILCHKDHPLNFRGIESNASCLCFDKTDCCCTSRKDVVCSYAFCQDYLDQPWYKCIDCGTGPNKGFCTACAKKCHHDHNISYNGFTNHYCDCGANALHIKCKASKFPPFNYLSSCTNREQKYQKTKQRLYHCKTCGITAHNQGICEACALFCHPGHKVVFIGTAEFACECKTMNECIAIACPEISSDKECSRVNDKKDAIFPAFVCLTCDTKGEKKFCKSCSLNCHKGHNIHFLEYSKFVCQCNPCQCYENK